MPLRLNGSCRCKAVSFSVESHTPVPYQLCYCGICRKTAGGGGFAINIMGLNATLMVKGQEAIRFYRAEIEDDSGHCETSTGRRNYCERCASALWLWDESWPDLVHPFASVIDGDLPKASEQTHLMLRYKAPWVMPNIKTGDQCFDLYPDQSIEDWHKSRNLWVD